MRILKDVAPIWMLPELIALLEDDDPAVRSNAAQALTRLTGETQGFEFNVWQSDRSQWSGGVLAWNEWWRQHRLSCSPPLHM